MTNDEILISPYKNILVDLMVPANERKDVFSYASSLVSIQLSPRQTFDLEMLAVGGFSPLTGFMGEADYRSVLSSMRLADGTVFPIPITLSVERTEGVEIGSDIALRDFHNDLLAVLSVEEIFEWDAREAADCILGTTDPKHPFRKELARMGRINLAGKLRVLALPTHVDSSDIRLSPSQTRERLAALGRKNVVAFQTRNPIHGAHEAMMQSAIRQIDGTLLIHPVVGLTKEGDIDHYTRVRVYRAVVEKAFPADRAVLALLPLAMRMAGPREAVLHAIIRRNYGANHFIVGRDHASPGVGSNGAPYYHHSAARELAISLENEIGIKIMPFDEYVFVPELGDYVEISKVAPGSKTSSLSGTQIREDYVNKGRPLPSWFTRPEVAAIINDSYPPKRRQGFCLWFTGLSGAGKSTTAEILAELLLERARQSTILDGDVVRTHLSKGLGFSKADRDANVTRIGFVASEIARHGGACICAAVSPYRQSRDEVRGMFQDDGFIEIFVDTPLSVCEGRDSKGMYAKARRGEITNFTGVDDVYETPLSPEIVLDTQEFSALENAHRIVDRLEDLGFIDPKKNHFADSIGA